MIRLRTEAPDELVRYGRVLRDLAITPMRPLGILKHNLMGIGGLRTHIGFVSVVPPALLSVNFGPSALRAGAAFALRAQFPTNAPCRLSGLRFPRRPAPDASDA